MGEVINRRIKHGQTKTRLYQIWRKMRYRCNNPRNVCYPNYGARGIKVCEEWDSSFIAFQNWALNHGYQESLSIDRIDNDGDYSPENCRWCTMEQQANNRRNNLIIKYDGQTKTVAEWSKLIHIPRHRLYKRLENGWPIEDALTLTEYRRDRRGS